MGRRPGASKNLGEPGRGPCYNRRVKSRLQVLLEGRVQGVFFRGQTESWAAGLGLTGWVRNRPDGRVEVVAEGRREDLEALLGLLRRGPSFARVDAADARWQDYTGEFDSFRIRRTGD
jgi:acylphosphatase